MKKHLSKLLFLVIGLSLAATVSYLNAWTEPTQTAPEGNVSAPINVGGDPSGLPQVKTGNIEANSLSAVGMIANQFCIGSDCITAWPSGGSSVPAGTVAAFNLTTCPAGWIPADGTNNTKDLRGVFIRGMESFNAGATSTTTDPDRSGSNTLGSYQGDMYASHNHTFTVTGAPMSIYYGGTNMANGYGTFDVGWMGGTIGYNGGNETRPKNVALLFCQKDGSVQVSGTSVYPFGGIYTLYNSVCQYGNPNTAACSCPTGYNPSLIMDLSTFSSGNIPVKQYACYKS